MNNEERITNNEENEFNLQRVKYQSKVKIFLPIIRYSFFIIRFFVARQNFFVFPPFPPLAKKKKTFIILEHFFDVLCRKELIMPKLKTHKGTKKRFRLSANGKPMHRSAGTSHLASRMSQKRSRHLRGTTEIGASEVKRITKALCGGSY